MTCTIAADVLESASESPISVHITRVPFRAVVALATVMVDISMVEPSIERLVMSNTIIFTVCDPTNRGPFVETSRVLLEPTSIELKTVIFHSMKVLLLLVVHTSVSCPPEHTDATPEGDRSTLGSDNDQFDDPVRINQTVHNYDTYKELCRLCPYLNLYPMHLKGRYKANCYFCQSFHWLRTKCHPVFQDTIEFYCTTVS